MLTTKQIEEIRNHLEKANNPLFFFDNDMDGLSSFLLLSRAIGRGKGIAIKSFPELDKSYARKITELKADYIFILDKPLVSKEFLQEVYEMNLPVVWIDHHNVKQLHDYVPENLYYYNPNLIETSPEPVTYLSYKIASKKEDIWIAMIGCISDGFLPDFSEDFSKKYKDLWGENIKKAFDVLYQTEIGKIILILNFSIKDRTSNVVKLIKFLLKASSPYEIVSSESSHMLKRYEQINKKYKVLIGKAKKFAKGKVLFFQYGGEFSLSADIANELWYKYPEKFIIVAFIKETRANISMRGKNAKRITEEAVQDITNATGGGHEYATGATLAVEDIPKFRKKIEELVKKYG